MAMKQGNRLSASLAAATAANGNMPNASNIDSGFDSGQLR
jgi:hypothetical protein